MNSGRRAPVTKATPNGSTLNRLDREQLLPAPCSLPGAMLTAAFVGDPPERGGGVDLDGDGIPDAHAPLAVASACAGALRAPPQSLGARWRRRFGLRCGRLLRQGGGRRIGSAAGNMATAAPHQPSQTE